MSKMRHFSGAFLVIWVLSTLFVGVWTGFVDGYNIVETNTDDGGLNVMQGLANINFMNGITTLLDSIYKITAPSNVFDLLGALASAGAGVLQTIGGIITFPADIFGVISGFYPGGIPAPVTQFVGALVITYVAFLILTTYTKIEV